MSNFIAEATVLVRPDTTKFRAQLVTQLAAVTKGITVPVQIAGIEKGTKAQKDFTAAQLAGVAAGKQAADAAKTHAQQLGQVQKAAIANTAGLLGLRGAVLTAGTAFIAATIGFQAFVKSLQAFAEFEATLSTLRVVTGATADEMKALSEASLRLGADVRLPAVTATDAAQAMLELAKAGLTAQEAIAGAEGVLQLATAAQISNAEAAEITANALNSFGLAGDQAVRVADDLANAANAAQGSISDFGLALRQVAAVGNQVGLTLEDTTALLTLLARNGLRGSDAGTSLRVALLRLINPTKQANQLLESFNIELRDMQGNIRADVFAQFGASVRDLTPTLRDAAAAATFGADAIRAVAIAGEEGTAGLRLAQFQIDQQGTAAQVAAARNEGLAGSLSALQSSAQTTATRLGGVLSPAIQGVVDGLRDMIGAVDSGIGALERLGRVEIPFLGTGLNEPLLPGGRDILGFDLQDLFKDTDEAGKRIAELQDRIVSLQQLRVAAQAAQLPRVADQFTASIKDAREELRLFKIDAGIIIPPQTEGEKRIKGISAALAKARKQAAKDLEAGFVDLQLDATIDRLNSKLITVVRNVGAGVESASRSSFQRVAGTIERALNTFSTDPLGEFADEALRNVRRLVERMGDLAPQAGAAGRRIADSLADSIQAAITAAAAAGNLPAAKALKALADRLAKGFEGDLKEAFGDIEVPLLGDEIAEALTPSGVSVAQQEAMGSQGGLLGALNARLQVVRDLIASGRATGQELISLYNEWTAINTAIETITKAAAAETKKKADEIAKNQLDATRSFLEAFDPAQQKLLNQITTAGLTEWLGDDIKLQKALVAFLRNQVKLIQDRIKNLNLTGDALAAAKAAIKAANQFIFNVVNDIAQDQKAQQERLQDLRDQQAAAINTKLDLRIQIAQSQENIAKELRARRAKLAQITKELVAAKKEFGKNSVQWLELKAAQAEQIAAIKALQDQDKKEGKDARQRAAEFFFEQLQAQQGFAANLMGNLITGPTAGLVGVPSPGGPGRGIQAAASVKEGKDGRGPTSGQAATTNDILLRILQQLKTLNGGQAAPEATHQRRVGGSALDYAAM